jgi:hypothetical protein
VEKVKIYQHNFSQATTPETPRLRDHSPLSHDLDPENVQQDEDLVLEKNPKSWSNFREEKLVGYASGLFWVPGFWGILNYGIGWARLSTLEN